MLVSRMAGGDEQALGTIYDRHGATLYALAFQILRDAHDAEEIVLETFNQAWRRAASYQQGRGSVAAWLVVLARSRALDRVRSRTRHTRAVERAVTSEQDAPAPAMGRGAAEANRYAEERERRGKVLAVLQQLPEPQRICIQLAYYEGLSQTEIAAKLSEPLGTIKTRTRQAMIKLRDLLGTMAPEPAS